MYTIINYFVRYFDGVEDLPLSPSFWSDWLGISRQVITRACGRGDVPGAYKSGKNWFIPPAGVKAALESGKIRLVRGRPRKGE